MGGLILGITGPAGSGKSSAARVLREDFQFSEITFAGPLKRACCELFGWTLAQFEGSRKEEVDGIYGISPRQAMQYLGDAMRAKFGAEVLIKRADLQYVYELQQRYFADDKPIAGWVFSDVRTEAEASFVRAKGGLLIHINRLHRQVVAPHHTEQGVGYAAGDYPLPNNGTLGSLEHRLAILVFNLLGSKRA